MIAVTGATGQLGRLVIARLLDRVPADAVVALARAPDKAADLGIATREADYDRPETLGPALEGVATLMLISSPTPGQRVAQHAALVAAAKRAGVGRIVYTSLLHADLSAISLAEDHRATEAALAESGVPHTLLRNGWYMENYAPTVAAALATGQVIGSAGDGRISAAPRADYAEAAAVVLTTEGHAGRTYELGGDESFTLAVLAAEIARQSGVPVQYENLSPEDHAAALVAAGVPEGFAPVLASWDAATARGDLEENSGTLSRLIGRPTTGLVEAVAALLKAR